MRRIKGLDTGLVQTMADIYTRSPGAAAVAAMAHRLGLGEVRLGGTTPYLAYVVDAPPGPPLDALASYATVVLETTVNVLSLETIPAWRRAAVWSAAPVAPAPADPEIADVAAAPDRPDAGSAGVTDRSSPTTDTAG